MNTKRVNCAADVIHRALTQNRTSAGIATALESAGLLMSPEKAAELEAAPKTVFRASHESIVMGLYTTAAEARRHCETVLRREYDASTTVSLWWVEDEDTVDQPEDGEAELFARVGPRGMIPGRTWRTGYVMTPLTVASEYDAEADE